MILSFTSIFAFFISLPVQDMGLYRQLNHELGVLCQAPPSKAINVCKIHAQLVFP